MTAELATNVYNLIHLSVIHAIGMNAASMISVLLGSFFQGGVLIGIGKILEAIQNEG